MDRRKLLTAAVFGLPTLLGAGIAVVAARFGFSSAQWRDRGEPEWVELCREEDIPADGPLARGFSFFRLEGWYWQKVERSVYVSRIESGEVVVFNRLCTHLTCPVTWKSGSHSFKCPCHGGVFDANGEVAGGPPLRPLDRVPHRIHGGTIQVQEA